MGLLEAPRGGRWGRKGAPKRSSENPGCHREPAKAPKEPPRSPQAPTTARPVAWAGSGVVGLSYSVFDICKCQRPLRQMACGRIISKLQPMPAYPKKAECSILVRYVVGWLVGGSVCAMFSIISPPVFLPYVRGRGGWWWWLVRCTKMQTSTNCGHRL